MEKDEKYLDGVQEQENVTPEEAPEVDTSNPSGDDPIYSMGDDELRVFLKGFGYEPQEGDDLRAKALERRAINNRHAKKKKEVPESAPSQPSDTDAIARFEKANERNAIRTIESSEEYEEVNENWDEIVASYVPRRGKDTAEDILDDILDAHAVWKRMQKPAEPDTKQAASEVAHTRGTKGTSPESTPQKKGGILKKSQGMSEWYEKK